MNGKMTIDALEHVVVFYTTSFFCPSILYHQLTSYHYSIADYAVGRVYNIDMLLVIIT
jgi:hypothetical protein